MNGQIIYVFTDNCKQITHIVKQLNYVWLTAEITGALIVSGTYPWVYSFYHVVLVKFYCDIIAEAVYAYQYFD